VLCPLGECYQRTKAVLHSSLPSDALIGRAAESTVISEFLSNHLSKMVPGSMYVSGAPGTGKTAVLMKAIEKIQVSLLDLCRLPLCWNSLLFFVWIDEGTVWTHITENAIKSKTFILLRIEVIVVGLLGMIHSLITMI